MRPASLLVLFVMAGLLTACVGAPKKDLAMERVRTQFNELQNNQELVGFAPLAVREAERAVRTAETHSGNDTQRLHLIYMADRRIQLAYAMAQKEQMKEELVGFEREHSNLLVRGSQLEADQARQEAEQALRLSQANEEDAERSRRAAEQANEREAVSARSASQALEEAQQAKALAESSATEAGLARREADLSAAQADSLRRQLDNLQLRQTESGVVVTLGDVLFETGQSELKAEAQTSLVEVVDLLQSEPDKQIRIEGHTDATGTATSNLILSEQRSKAVLNALANLGVDRTRITAVGMGEDFPIASNETEEGKGRNRRVDVILLDE